jgi:hypothetical protein
MSKVDLSFVTDMIDGYIQDLKYDMEIAQMNQDVDKHKACNISIQTLTSLKKTLKHFIKDANTLGKKK